MVKKSKTAPIIDEISRIRIQLEKSNEIQHRNIRDQLELSLCKITQHLNDKPKYLIEYLENLKMLSADDVGQSLLENIHDVIKRTKDDYLTALGDYQNYQMKTEVEYSEFLLKMGIRFLELMSRLEHVEEILNTQIGAPKDPQV
ncbi:MAG: hypothetical protein KGL95_13345 [Patescibacteria group bacterium]|nr:hypothetical protein [Patescibacteria group bacterium]